MIIALVDIRHAGRGQLAQRLREGIQNAKARNARLDAF
jgi:hypothetical protein